MASAILPFSLRLVLPGLFLLALQPQAAQAQTKLAATWAGAFDHVEILDEAPVAPPETQPGPAPILVEISPAGAYLINGHAYASPEAARTAFESLIHQSGGSQGPLVLRYAREEDRARLLALISLLDRLIGEPGR